MIDTNYFTITSSIILEFKDNELRNYSYEAFLPEFNTLKTDRTEMDMQKDDKKLVFQIKSKDITAFRASVSDIIGLGKIIESTSELCE